MSSVVVSYGYWQNLSDGTYLPSIESGYGIDYEIPFVGSEQTVYFPFNRIWDYYSQGVQTPIIWKDFSENCNECASKPNYRYSSDFWARHTTLTNGFTDITEQQLDALKAAFDSDVSWLWGSLDEGGAFIFKSADNPSDINSLRYRVYMCWGEFEREPENPDYSDGKYFYYFSTMDGSNRKYLEQMYKVGFFIDADDSAIEQNSIMGIYYCTNISDNRMFCGNVSGSSSVFMEPPEVCTAMPEWEAGLASEFWVETPVRAWYFEGGSTNSKSHLYGFHMDNTIWISGNPFSDDEYGDEPSGTGGTNTSGGGYGTPATDTGDVDGESADDLNQLTAINSGLATLFNPTQAELASFANWLYTDITDNIADQLKKLQTNPIEYILFVSLCKFNPPTSGRMEIGFAGFGSGVSAQKISNQFMEIDCGTIDYKEQFCSFLDYHSKVQIYLPFCGTHELNVDDVMGSRINVNYLIDLLSGSCIARVKITRSVRATAPQDSRVNDVIYEFQGNVYLSMPISSTDWRGTYQALINLAGSVFNGAASGGGYGAVAGAVTGAANAIMAEKVTVSRSGQAGSAYGFMNNKKPYLILERPIQSVPVNWGGFEGYMSNNRAKIGNLKGYTETDPNTVWSDNIHCTDSEAEEIRSMFNSGVYL